MRLIEYSGGVARAIQVEESFYTKQRDFFPPGYYVFPGVINTNAPYYKDKTVIAEMWDGLLNGWSPIRVGDYIVDIEGQFTVMEPYEFGAFIES